jgi:hypothetical protein
VPPRTARRNLRLPDGFRTLRGYPELQVASEATQDPEGTFGGSWWFLISGPVFADYAWPTPGEARLGG